MENPFFALLICILIVLVSAAFGRKLLKLLKVETNGLAENLVFGIGLGLGTLSYFVLALGLLRLLYPWILILLVGIMTIVSLKEIGGLLSGLINHIRRRVKLKLSASSGLIAASSIFLGATVLIYALAPSSGLDWDGLAYHLAIPKMYLAKHAIIYVPFISHSNFPFLTEMLYTIGLAVGSVILAKLFHLVMYIATAITIFALGRKHISGLTGRLGALLFMSVPVVLWEAGLAYADITTALYITLAVYAVLNWEKDGRTSWLVICGVMCGFALGTKVLAAVPTAVLCGWILIGSLRERGWSRGAGLALIVGGLAILVGSPWYIKSCIYTGNPVYPFLYNVFGGRYWSTEAAEMYRSSQLSLGMGRGLSEFLLTPWNLTMNGFKFFDTPRVYGLIGAAFVGLIPLQILAGWSNKVITRLNIIILVFLAAWFVLMQQSRYLIGVIPLACIIAASSVDLANAKWPTGRHIVNVFVGMCIALSIFTGWALATGSREVIIGSVSQEDYLSKTLDVYDAERYVNDNLPEDAKVVLLDEVRGFYLDREYIWGNPGHHEMIPWSSFKSGADMVRYFMDHGYTNAIINWKFAGTDLLHKNFIPDAIGNGMMVEIYASNGVGVYEFGE